MRLCRGAVRTGYAVIQWAIKDNHLRNSKHGQAQGLFP